MSSGDKAEELVKTLCDDFFLEFWTYKSPYNQNKHELCDVFVVCEPYMLIFSVKDNTKTIEENRWIKNAITESKKQLKGSLRYSKSNTVVYKDNHCY